MTKTMTHTNCTHPATKAGRAKCRKDRAARVTALRAQANDLLATYYDGEGDAEELIAGLMHIFPEVKTAYFDTEADTDELMALAARLTAEL